MILLLAAGALAGCATASVRTSESVPAAVTASPGPVPSPAPTPAAASPAASPVEAAISSLAVTSNVWPGVTDLLFDVYDPDFRSLTASAVPMTVHLERPDGAWLPEQPAWIDQPTPGQRVLYQARIAPDVPGEWRLHVAAADGSGRRTVMPLTVLPDDGSPALGAAFPAIRTPTAASVINQPGGLAAISSVPGADPAFYERSVDELLARGEPFLLTVDSVGFRTTETCGAGLGHLIHLHHELPTMRMVHAEPYRMRLDGSTLVLDSPDGSPVPTDWATTLGATEPPWIFVVGADGRLWAKFHGIFGSDELRSAIDTVLQ